MRKRRWEAPVPDADEEQEEDFGEEVTMYDYDMFKTVRMKGFDRDEVITYIKEEEEEHKKTVTALETELKERDKTIEELRKRLVEKDEQRAALENEIDTKYKKYIEHYDRIGGLIYESQIKADKTVADAKEEADRLVIDAQKEADAIRKGAETDAAVRSQQADEEVNNKLAEGKRQYMAMQDIMNDAMDQLSQAQRKFMMSYKEVHSILQGLPGKMSVTGVTAEGPDDAYDDEFDGDTDELPIEEIRQAAEIIAEPLPEGADW